MGVALAHPRHGHMYAVPVARGVYVYILQFRVGQEDVEDPQADGVAVYDVAHPLHLLFHGVHVPAAGDHDGVGRGVDVVPRHGGDELAVRPAPVLAERPPHRLDRILYDAVDRIRTRVFRRGEVVLRLPVRGRPDDHVAVGGVVFRQYVQFSHAAYEPAVGVGRFGPHIAGEYPAVVLHERAAGYHRTGPGDAVVPGYELPSLRIPVESVRLGHPPYRGRLLRTLGEHQATPFPEAILAAFSLTLSMLSSAILRAEWVLWRQAAHSGPSPARL